MHHLLKEVADTVYEATIQSWLSDHSLIPAPHLREEEITSIVNFVVSRAESNKESTKVKILKGRDIAKPGHYWVRKNCAVDWTILQVEVPERCHADCGIGTWDFVEVKKPYEEIE